MISKKRLVSNVNNIITYSIVYNCLYILGWRISSLSIFKKICLVYQKVESNIYKHFKAIGEYIDPAFDIRVII